MTRNRHGLSRTIPAAVERAVRQRDGFGCIICGKAIYDYEHYDPEFVDAEEHHPDGIVLLCIEHHGLKTRGQLSKETIKDRIARPKCKEAGFSFGPFDIGTLHPEIVLGRMRCTNVKTLISFDGESVLTILPPLSIGLPFRVNANLRNEVGNSVLEIVDNEWRTPITNWDVDISGALITIRRGLGDIVLVIKSEPPHRIVIERLNMYHRGHQISCREGHDLKVVTRQGNILKASELVVEDCDSAIEIRGNILAVGVGGGSVSISGSFDSGPPIYPISLGSIGADLAGKPRRVARCACGSGLRYKECHGHF